MNNEPDSPNGKSDKDMKDEPSTAQSREEHRAEEVADVNNELDAKLGHDPSEGEKETRLEDVADPADSIDEHMPADSESIEDKVQDMLNSGVLRQ